jgi:hypothetical protein
MPRVERDAEVTVAILTFKPRWLEFFLEGIESSKQEARYRLLAIANDAGNEVKTVLNGRVADWVDFHAEDLSQHYIRRVYAAWSESVLCAKTPWVILANDDMWLTDHAVDELLYCKRRVPKSLPCGLLVESGRIPSAMPETVRDFGTTPETFRRADFLAYAETIRQPRKTEPGRLYQPVLVDRQEYHDLGGFPDGNIGGVSGDKLLFQKYTEAGFQWVTCLGSVSYHVQEGALRDA